MATRHTRNLRAGRRLPFDDGPRPRYFQPGRKREPGEKTKHPRVRRKPKPRIVSFPKVERKTIPFGKLQPFGLKPEYMPKLPEGFKVDRFAGPLRALPAAIRAYTYTPSDHDYLRSMGWQLCCNINLPVLNARRFVYTGGSPPCSGGTGDLCGAGGQVPNTSPIVQCDPGRGQSFYRGTGTLGGLRMVFSEIWQRHVPAGGVPLPAHTLPPPPVFVPYEMPPYPLPEWLDPMPVPFSPMPHPFPPPLADPDPWDGEDVGLPRRNRRPQPVLDTPVGTSPTIETGGKDGYLIPGRHDHRPPTKDEREKKRRLTPSESKRWLEFLVGGFTETDDVVSAMYKALPWYVRRWKGDDGVWRDRDINTKQRLERLWRESDGIDVKESLEQLIKAHKGVQDNDLEDRLYGELGNQLKKQTEKLAKDGLYSGTNGLGSQRYTSSWDGVYEKLKADAAAKGFKGKWYTVTRYNPRTGDWERVQKLRPIKQIPWFRQKSHYPLLTNRGNVNLGYERDRYYYASRRTTRSIDFW